MIIGPHLSTSKGYVSAVKAALSIGANTFQFFSRNPRGSAQKAYDEKDVKAAEALIKDHHFGPILAHAPYTLNPASLKEDVRDFAAMVLSGDLDYLEKLPCNLYVFHPGSHGGAGIDVGIQKTAEILNHAIKPHHTTTVLFEQMSGKGTEIGKTFEEIASLIDHIVEKDKVGVCLDTCHIYAAGYDIQNDLDGVLRHFDEVIGLEYLKAIHLNDSLMDFESHKDRHAAIGEGVIGLQTLRRVVTHEKLKDLPFFLETPHENIAEYGQEIQLLQNI